MTTKNKILHFDTVDRIPVFDTTFYTKNLAYGSGQEITSSQSFNSKLPIPTPINNVTSISLKMIEFPFTVFNVRSSNNSNYFSFNISYNGVYADVNVYLKEKNYTSISTLLSDLNAGIVSAIASNASIVGGMLVLYVNPLDSSKITFKTNGTPVYGNNTWYGGTFIYPNILANTILGFSNDGSPQRDFFRLGGDSYSYANCTNNYNLQPDNYFNMHFRNLETSPSNANGRPSTFKIPLNGTFGEVLYWNANSGTEQIVYIDRPNTTLSFVDMFISDRWGFPVYGNGALISFSLNIEYEEAYYNN